MITNPMRHLTLGLLLVAGTSSGVIAGENTSANESHEVIVVATRILEYGVGYVSNSSYRFGRFSGLKDAGLYVIGAFDVTSHPGRPDYLRLHGRNLGLDSRRLSLEYGEQGKFETHVEYNELPNFKMDSVHTPYQGVDGDNLKVAPGASPTVLMPLSLDTKRKRFTGGVSFFPQKDWKASLEVRQEHKDGTDWVGGGLQRTSGGAGISPGQTYTVILPEPIDQTTTELDAGLEYNGEQSQLRLTLHGSLFNNSYSSLRWEEPGFTTSGRTTLPNEGQLALAPDNRFFQLGLSGSSRISGTTRVTGLLSVGLMQQDDFFLPYGLNASTALPRSSLDGEVSVYSMHAGFTSQPLRSLRLKAQYRFNERDNRTPQAAYLYEVMDSGKPPHPKVTVTNEPLSYRKHKARLDANYRFSSKWSGSAGLEHRYTERDYSDVAKSREYIGSARLQWRPREDIDASLRLTKSSREASNYEAELLKQNPLLRKYHLADRDQTKTGLLLNYAPTSNVNIGFGADLVEDSYTDSLLGLSNADSRNYNSDVCFYLTPEIQLTAFYTHDHIESHQLGSDPALPLLYKVDFDDQVDTVGLGGNLKNAWNRWDLGIIYRYSRGAGDIKHTDLNPASGGALFPTLKNELHHVELSAVYDLNKDTRVKLMGLYEKMSTEDWAVDGVSVYPVKQLLTLGNNSENYDVYAFMVAVQHLY